MRLLIATRNKHKVQEIRAILGNKYEYLSLADFPDTPEVHENASSFEGNARKKAMEVAEWLKRHTENERLANTIVLADDSGLEVDALDGAPGIRSARYAHEETNYAANNRKLIEELKHTPPEQRTARFRCVIAIVTPDGEVRFAQGACEGRIGFEERGTEGFGYDPLFIPEGHTQTFAELGSEVKDLISHRARALAEAKVILVGAHGGAPEK